MDRRGRIVAGLLLATSPALGGDHEPAGGAESRPRTLHQAGHPDQVSRLAIPSYNDHYTGGYVGGGQAHGGHGRLAGEGTWGWDYTPFRPGGRGIFLGWSHGRRYQGGTGRYATDGPHPLHAITEAVREHSGKE